VKGVGKPAVSASVADELMPAASEPPRSTARSGVGAWIAAHRHVLVVWAAMCAWAGSMFVLVRSEYERYQLGRFDLGNMVQAVWSTTQGRPLESTTGAGEQISRLAGHVDPILVLLAPLWVVVPAPLPLAAAQIAAVSLGALPVLWLGRRHLGSESAATLMAVAYLAYPWLSWSALDAIHPVTFAIPLLLYAIWALDSDRLGTFAVFAVLTAATGELMGFTIGALGIWYAVARGRRSAGLVIAGAGGAWSFVALFFVVPAFRGGSSPFYGFYERVGGSPRGLLETVLTDPTVVASELLAGGVIVYVVALAAPLAGLFLLAPGLAAVGLPQLVLNARADPLGPVDPRQHYLAAILPALVMATVLGIARLREKDRVPLSTMVVVLCFAVSAIFGPWGLAAVPLWHQTDVSPRHVVALDRAVAAIPDEAPVSASNRVGGHLAARRYLYLLPMVGRAEWIVLDTHDLWLPDDELPVLDERTPAELDALRRKLEGDPVWARVYAEDGVYVFRKRSA
jgi:uncharacterized membrane protein